MSSCPTLATIRVQAQRVYGADVLDVVQSQAFRTTGIAIVLFLRGRRVVTFEGRSKAAARRLALETLSSLPSREA